MRSINQRNVKSMARAAAKAYYQTMPHGIGGIRLSRSEMGGIGRSQRASPFRTSVSCLPRNDPDMHCPELCLEVGLPPIAEKIEVLGLTKKVYREAFSRTLKRSSCCVHHSRPQGHAVHATNVRGPAFTSRGRPTKVPFNGLLINSRPLPI